MTAYRRRLRGRESDRDIDRDRQRNSGRWHRHTGHPHCIVDPTPHETLWQTDRQMHHSTTTDTRLRVSYWSTLVIQTVTCPEVIYVRPTVNTVFINKHCCSSVLMLRPNRLEQSSLICTHYALLTVSLVLGRSSRLMFTESAESLTTRRLLKSRHACSGTLFLTVCWTSTDCLRWT